MLQRQTYRKEDPKHYQIVNESRTTKDTPCIPHDFLPFQAYLIFHRRVISLAKGNTGNMTYLVRQGQQEVIEEDGGDRNYVVLVVVFCSGLQRRQKMALTSIAVLGI